MNNRRKIDYRVRAASDRWRETDAAAFRTLAGRGTRIGHGAVVCLGAERMPLNREVDVIPVGWV